MSRLAYVVHPDTEPRRMANGWYWIFIKRTSGRAAAATLDTSRYHGRSDVESERSDLPGPLLAAAREILGLPGVAELYVQLRSPLGDRLSVRLENREDVSGLLAYVVAVLQSHLSPSGVDDELEYLLS